MTNLIHKIRRQPEEIRRHVLHLFTLIFAIILVFLWVYSLGSSLTNPNTQTGISQDLKPFSALKDNMTSGYNDISQPSTDSNSVNSSTDSSTDSNNDSGANYLRAQENSL